MKIKCPFCKGEKGEYPYDLNDLSYHLELHPKETALLIFKIHRTIEKVELDADGDSSEMTSYECDMAILQTLKSLLEDEKK